MINDSLPQQEDAIKLNSLQYSFRDSCN